MVLLAASATWFAADEADRPKVTYTGPYTFPHIKLRIVPELSQPVQARYMNFDRLQSLLDHI
jgi:hypothetical protein